MKDLSTDKHFCRQTLTFTCVFYKNFYTIIDFDVLSSNKNYFISAYFHRNMGVQNCNKVTLGQLTPTYFV